jgi:cytochrome c oxidase subunit 2
MRRRVSSAPSTNEQRHGSKAAGFAGFLILLLGACAYQHYQSDFGGGALEDDQFRSLFWLFLSVCAFTYFLVIAFLVAGIARSRRAEANVVETGRHHHSTSSMRRALIGWAAVVGSGLTALAIASFFTDRSMALAANGGMLFVRLTANQWWWDVQYGSNDPAKTFHTANELHLPLGVPVRITLESNDVIHSFWVPSLSGKEDLIPGRRNDITILARRAGIYRGQCAEFCGLQHAHMSLVVDVDSYPDFIKWRNHQLQPASLPTGHLAVAGYKYVTSGPCGACHNINGTPARGSAGPDLTHLASRRSIGAGMIPMSTGNLYGWVGDPQALKPGNHMPTIGLEPDKLHAAVAYLETLK